MPTRREFLTTLSAGTAGILVPWHSNAVDSHPAESDKWGRLLPLRQLGDTGENVTLLGVGGYHIGWTTERDAEEVIETAMAGGIRFFDTAHNYGKGKSEERYGRYLVPKYREEIFLMTKTQAKDRSSALAEIETSLRRLNTDQLDLLQVHSLFTPEDTDERVNNGVFDALAEALDKGRTRYIGFTGHQNPAALQRVLDRMEDTSALATCQLPVNVVDAASESSFVHDVVPRLQKRRIGILAMKTLADGRFFNRKNMGEKKIWETNDPVVPERVSTADALGFAWSLPISVLITGAENTNLLQEKIDLARSISTQTSSERAALVERVSDLATDGRVEYYKKV